LYKGFPFVRKALPKSLLTSFFLKYQMSFKWLKNDTREVIILALQISCDCYALKTTA
jgi:hypothetical protein